MDGNKGKFVDEPHVDPKGWWFDSWYDKQIPIMFDKELDTL